jgi:hypothetical protein
VPVELAYRVRAEGHDSGELLQYLKALGTQYVAVHGPKSKEYYRDFRRPDRLNSLPVVYRNDDDVVYELPGRPLAHVLNRGESADRDVLEHPGSLARYVAAIDDPARPTLAVQWLDVDRLTISGHLKAGDLVSVQINAAEGWKARQDGREVSLGIDGLGFLVVNVASGSPIQLTFEGTTEQRLMAALSALAWVTAIGFWLKRGRHPLAAAKAGHYETE